METAIFEHILPFGLGQSRKYEIQYYDGGTLRVFVDGKEVTGYDLTKVLIDIFSDAIDIDSWKHSWHMKVSEFHNVAIRDQIRNIIEDARVKRQSEINYLGSVLRLLMTQKVYTPEDNNTIDEL